jgi:capsid portal protein
MPRRIYAHRFSPGLAGIIPANTAGLGDSAKYDEAYFKNETKLLIQKMVNAVERILKSAANWGWCLI